jgi:signal transduction histidine kinase
LNIYNVLLNELAQMGRDLTGDVSLLNQSLAECASRGQRLATPEHALHDASHTGDLESLVHRELAPHLQRTVHHGADAATRVTHAQLDALLWILSVRSREFVARSFGPVHTTHVAIGDLELDLQEFFQAMQEHSRGKYRFVYNLAVQETRDYYVDLRFASTRSSSIVMPTLLRDVMRDLIANSRKYTAPGGQLRIALHTGPAGLRCVIEDNGRGIPAAELADVIHYGRRGSNVGDVRSYGAGCGLTKAFLVTRKLGGRFWIASEPGRGTRIRIWLPPRESGVTAMHALQE